jgi:carboxyl-terminal processing protease
MRVWNWLGIVVMAVVIAFLLTAEMAVWQVSERQRDFAGLPPGKRQLALFDAYASHIERYYYDRDFIDGKWPALRDEWRTRAAAAAHDDVYLYDQIFMQLSQRVPSSHVAARAPASLVDTPIRKGSSPRALLQPGDGGFDIAMVRRGPSSFGSIVDVVPGSPADAAGIEPGWRIVSFQSCRDTEKISATFITWGTPAQRLDAEAGKVVERSELGTKTEAEFTARYQRKVDYTCGPYSVRAPFETSVVGDGIRYIRFDAFSDAKVIDQVLSTLDVASAQGVILDLRGNTGGHVTEEMRVVDRLMPEKSLVGTSISAAAREELRAGAGRKYSGPLAVLIGPHTASAGEVLAAALQDNRLATVLGRSSAGATLFSSPFPLPDGGFVQVAYLDFVRPSGRRIEGIGVVPDIGIMPALADVRAGRDVTLERAIEELGARN